MKLAELSWPEADALDRDTVVLYPIAALEQHSRHLPFFTDSILCEQVAARIEAALPKEVLLLPVQWLGASAHHLGMAGTLTVENDTYLRLLAEPLRCLLDQGFRRAFILNGHGGNVDGFHLALRQLAREFPTTMLGGASYWDLATEAIAEILEGSRKSVGHACEFETSLMLHLRPDLVRTSEIADDALCPMAESLENIFLPLDMKRQTGRGGNGQATLASAAKGARLFEVVVNACVRSVSAFRGARFPKTEES
jgi:creatinine amidohydrolase